MARKKRRNTTKGDWIEDDAKPLNNPFAALASKTTSQPKASPQPTPQPATSADATGPKAPARAVVRTQRKGRGGKTVTVVTHLGLDTRQSQAWCKALRRQLGCGGQVEGDTLVFHGDQKARLPALLEARGVAKVTLG